MNAKRWPPLAIFVGGCLTGAAFITLRAGDGEPAPSKASANADVGEPTLGSVAPSTSEQHALRASNDHAVELAAVPHAPDATEALPASHTDGAERDAPEPGHSVADVLARLESEYREQRSPEPAPPPSASAAPVAAALPPASEQRSNAEQRRVVDATSAKPAASESPVVVAIANSPARALPAEPLAVAPSTSLAPVALAAAEPSPATADAPAVAAPTRSAEIDSQIQQLALMQQTAAIQQTALMQQFALLQYVQLLSLSTSGRGGAGTYAPRPVAPPFNGRIVAARPSTFSATDNPWGFENTSTILTR